LAKVGVVRQPEKPPVAKAGASKAAAPMEKSAPSSFANTPCSPRNENEPRRPNARPFRRKGAHVLLDPTLFTLEALHFQRFVELKE
jgi:hypothetical protein